MCRHGGLLKCFAERGVGVCRTGDIFRACSVFHSQDGFRDHLTSIGTNDMHAENPVGLLLSKELDEAFGIKVRLCSGVSSEGEFADVVLYTSSLEILLGLSYPSNLGVGVDDGRNAILVDVAVTRLEVLDGSDTFLLSLVRQHGSKGHVTDTLDVFDRR